MTGAGANQGTVVFGTDDVSRHFLGLAGNFQLGSTFSQFVFSNTGSNRFRSGSSDGVTSFKFYSNVAHTSGNIFEIDDGFGDNAVTIDFDKNFGIGTTVPNTTFDVAGGMSMPIFGTDTTHTALITQRMILCGSGNETFTVTLPTAAAAYNSTDSTGLVLEVKNIGTGTITVDGDNAETIDGVTTIVLSTQYSSITIQSDGTEWWIK